MKQNTHTDMDISQHTFPAWVTILAEIPETGMTTMTKVHMTTGMTYSHVIRIKKSMERLGIIEQTTAPNLRLKAYKVTQKGRALHTAIQQARTILATLTKNLKP